MGSGPTHTGLPWHPPWLTSIHTLTYVCSVQIHMGCGGQLRAAHLLVLEGQQSLAFFCVEFHYGGLHEESEGKEGDRYIENSTSFNYYGRRGLCT